MPLVFRKWRFHFSGRSKLIVLQSSTLVFRKWCFHLSGRSRLLPFCKVAHAICLQKVAFPFFWALEAPVVLRSSTCHWSSESGVSIFLGVARFAVKPLRCRPHPHQSQIQAAGGPGGAASEVLRGGPSEPEVQLPACLSGCGAAVGCGTAAVGSERPHCLALPPN